MSILQRKAPLLCFRFQKLLFLCKARPICLQFSRQMRGLLKLPLQVPFRCSSTLKSAKNCSTINFKEKDFHQPSLFLDDLNSTDLSMVVERFQLKSLNIDYLFEYGVKVTSDLSSLLFPFHSLENLELSAIQSMTYDKDTKSITTCFTSLRDSDAYLFGWTSIAAQEKEIVVVSNPLDAIAVYQETGILSVSLPHDIFHLPLELINPFKSFQKVILWLKSEQLGPEILSSLAQSFGKKSYIIRSQDYSSSALSCLQSGLKIKEILRNAESIYHEGVDMLGPYRMILFDRFKNSEKHSGVKWKRFSALNEIMKGHRKGELTVFSGQTGTGKTTFVSEYSLDLCMQGLPTLWASFEISNERLLETMFCQYAQCSFVKNTEGFHHWYDKFEKLPMYVLNIGGRRSLREMFKAMRLYVRVYDVQHVVVDNLQFLMNIENFNSSLDQFRRQDEIFGHFRGFATSCNCHVTLVIHPRKEPEFTELNNASISGTSKATQEADNILILQNTKTRQYIHVTKNRFSGTRGCVMVEFDKGNYTFRQSKVNNTVTEDGLTIRKNLS